jgi:hypothetical protein
MSLNSMSIGRAMPAEKEKSRLAVAVAAMWERFVAAQQTRADHLVRPYLAQLPEKDLRELGYSTAEIADIRTYRHHPVVNWI